MTRTVLHVGMPRTGTTWLQTEVFPKHPDIEYHQTYDWPKLVGLSQHPQPGALRVRVISCEHWTDWRGGWRRIEREIAMLRDIFGVNTRILLIARDPVELVESVYRYSVQHGGAIGRKYFKVRFEAEHPGWELWENHRAAWRLHFGSVSWLNFKQLQQTPDKFLKELASVLGICDFKTAKTHPVKGIDLTPVNTSLREPWLTVMQGVNCVSGTHDLAEWHRPMGRLRRAITAANGWGR